MLSRLRQVEDKTIKILQSMPVLIDIEKDTLYKKGILKGIEKGIEKGEIKKQKDVVLRGHMRGISISILSNITGLSEIQVKGIINQVSKHK